MSMPLVLKRTAVDLHVARMGGELSTPVFGGHSKSPERDPRFRTIQVYHKDLRVLPVHREPTVSWHGGFREGSPCST
jgi:hypothetical protein